MLGLIGRNLGTVQDRCVALLRRAELDGLIADGTEWRSRRLCEARGRQLVQARRRAAVATEIETCIEMARSGALSGSSQMPVLLVDLRVAEVCAADHALMALARALRSAERPEARGVAMAMLLVRHGQSPLFVAHGPNDVASAANAAQRALTGPPGKRDGAGEMSRPTGSDTPVARRASR